MRVSKSDCSVIDEMSIVDVLTKLIFDSDSKLEDCELLVVELLAQVDESLVGRSRRDISECLRAMGVDEMIIAVNRIKSLMEQQQGVIASASRSDRSGLHRQ